MVYSTVVDFSPTGGRTYGYKGYSLHLSIQLYSSDLWTPPYTPYQTELFHLIRTKHELDGMNFKQISDWMNENNYLTPRGKVFTQGHCWSIYFKKIRSINRVNRQFDPKITDMKIDVVDYSPVPII